MKNMVKNVSILLFFLIVVIFFGCSDGSKKAYNQALIENTVSAFEEFINDYPESQWVEAVAKHIQEIKKEGIKIKIARLTELITLYGNTFEQYRVPCWEGKDYPYSEHKNTFSATAFVKNGEQIIVATKNIFDTNYIGNCGGLSKVSVNNREDTLKLSDINFCTMVNMRGSRIIKLSCKNGECMTYYDPSRSYTSSTFQSRIYVNNLMGEKSITDVLMSLGVNRVCN